MAKHHFLFRVLLLSLAIVMMLNFPYVQADDNDFKTGHDDKEESWVEEVGESLGWGTVLLASAAGMLLPLRRGIKPVKEHFPVLQKSMITLIKGLTKYHVRIGIMAVSVSLIHGFSMYVSEDDLGIGDWMGAFASALMIMAGLIGSIMAMKKNKVRSLRNTHIHFLILSALLAIAHVVTS